MAINQLTTSNTFGDWLVTTNNLVAVANSLTGGAINTDITKASNHANAAFAFANTVNVRTQSAYNLSNSTNTIAYATYNHVNADFTTINTLSDYVDTINVRSQSAYDKANATNSFAQTIFLHANSGFNQSNSANILIYQIKSNLDTLNVTVQSSFDLSNTTNIHARSAYTHANAAFDFANTVNVRTQSAYDFANTVNVRTQSAFNLTNSTLAIANSDVTSINITAGTYGSANLNSIFRVEANGRISAIANAAYPTSINVVIDTTSTNEQFLLFSDTIGVTQNVKRSPVGLTFKPSSNTLTVSNISISGTTTENVYSFNTSSSTVIDPKFGSIQIITFSSNATFTHVIQTGQSVTVFIPPTTFTNPTWPTIAWRDGTAPTIQGARYTAFKLVNVGPIVYGIKLSQ